MKVRSVGNTLTLHETALIEAFNLKAAIEYVLKNAEAAREALTDMPPRSEDELDAVTLHNQVTKLNSNKNQQLILNFLLDPVNFLNNWYLSSYKTIPMQCLLLSNFKIAQISIAPQRKIQKVLTIVRIIFAKRVQLSSESQVLELISPHFVHLLPIPNIALNKI